MSEITDPDLAGVSETSLITIYIRALESQRPDALVKDERAEAVIRHLDQKKLQKTLALTDDFTRAAVILKNNHFDGIAQDFLSRNPDAVVVHIGCGFDTRFERVDNGRVEWYDLDLPDVVALRRKLIGGERERYHLLSGSVLENAWLEAVDAFRSRPFLFIAEGVFMYLEEVQIRSLVLRLLENFPVAELVFDAYSPFMRWAHNAKVTRTRVGARLHSALKHGRDLERWSFDESTGAGICLLEEWFPFRCPEPRIRNALLVRLLPFIATSIGVFHYRLQGGGYA